MDDQKQTSAAVDGLSLHELRDLRGRVDQAIRSHEDRRRKAALEASEEAVRAHGLTMADVLRRPTSASSKGRAAAAPAGAPAYINPEDLTRTWSDRGRRPAWVKAALEQGKRLEDLVA